MAFHLTRALRKRAALTASAAFMNASYPLAERIKAQGLNLTLGHRSRAKDTHRNDRRRVHLVSEPLCDDILKYIGPSLERHRGCDVVDLNPGVALWSSKIHDFLSPRKHIIMDADAPAYTQFYPDLAAKDNVTIIPQNGLVWERLLKMLDEHLPDHVPLKKGEEEPRRHDSLLVMANLSSFPPKAMGGFSSVSSMILYQFIASISTSSLFQRYGQVRMLVFTNNDEVRKVLPRSLMGRKRFSFKAELSCDWIHEVGGFMEPEPKNLLRDEWMNRESTHAAMARMAAAGIYPPKGRESPALLLAQSEPELMGQRLAGVRVPILERPLVHKVQAIGHDGGKDTWAALSSTERNIILRGRKADQEHIMFLELLQEFEAVNAAWDTLPPEEASAKEEAFTDRINRLRKNPRKEFRNLRDMYHLFRSPRPSFLWDRRAYEPLSFGADEFFPNAPTALLDIQPKAMAPQLRAHQRGGTRSGDLSDALLKAFWNKPNQSIPAAMEYAAPGFSNMLENVPSVRDPARGGLRSKSEHACLTARMVNEDMWVEIVQALVDWPFKPSYERMMGMSLEDEDIDEDTGAEGSVSW